MSNFSVAFYPTDFTAKISNFAAKSLGVLVIIITNFPFLLPYVALVVRDSGGGGPDTTHKAFPYTIDFRRRRPELSARADLGETVETAPAARGTDSADI